MDLLDAFIPIFINGLIFIFLTASANNTIFSVLLLLLSKNTDMIHEILSYTNLPYTILCV